MPLFKVTPVQYAGFLSVFKRSSVNGYLGSCEIKAFLEKAGVKATSSEIKQMITSISVDSIGIDFQGFIDFVSCYQSLRDIDGEYADAFRIFDRSGNGCLSRDDISCFMKKLGLNVDLDALFKEMGNDSDVIEYDDFVKLMKKRL